LNPCRIALLSEYVHNLPGTSGAEYLPVFFFTPANAVFFNQGDKIPWCEPGKGRFAEMKVSGEVVIRLNVKVCKITAASA
jgi:hypothetical protein